MAKKKIIIADDEEMSRMIIKRFLDSDYEVLEAADGDETLKLLTQQDVAAVILDIIMPTVDGLTVLEKIKGDERYQYTGILVATSTKEHTERQALNLGADDVVAKPYDPTVIKKRLNNILLLKQYKKQADLAYGKDVQGLVEEHLLSIVGEAEQVSAKLREVANVLALNDENKKLIELMVQNIKQEARRISDLFVREVR